MMYLYLRGRIPELSLYFCAEAWKQEEVGCKCVPNLSEAPNEVS